MVICWDKTNRVSMFVTARGKGRTVRDHSCFSPFAFLITRPALWVQVELTHRVSATGYFFFFFFKRSTHLWHNCKRWPVDLQQNQKATAWPFGSILRGAFMLYRECTWLLCSCCRCTPRMKHTTCCFCPLHLYCHIADILDIYIRHTTFSF